MEKLVLNQSNFTIHLLLELVDCSIFYLGNILERIYL